MYWDETQTNLYKKDDGWYHPTTDFSKKLVYPEDALGYKKKKPINNDSSKYSYCLKHFTTIACKYKVKSWEL